MASVNILSRSFKRFLASRIYALNLCLNKSLWTPENIVKSPFKDIDVPNRTVPEHVWENIERWPDKVAMVCGLTDRSITFHQLYKYSRTFGAQLRTKLKLIDGDIVLVMMHNCPEYAPVSLGAIEAGAVVSTVNPAYTVYEVQRQIILSKPKVLVGTPTSVPILQEALKFAKMDLPIIACDTTSGLPSGTISFQELVAETHVNLDVLKNVHRKIEDVRLLPYSSGTTGLPKGVELTNKNLVSNFIQQDEIEIRHYNDTSKSHQDSALAILPFYHIYGLSVVMIHKLSVGCKIVTLPKFQPDTLISTLEKYKISLFCAAPPLILFLGSYAGIKPEHLEPIQKLVSGAAPLPKVDIDNVLARNKKIDLIQVYGLTETSPLVTTFQKGSKKLTTAGIPLSSTELKIIDSEGQSLGPNQVGELLIRGPQVMKGYKDNPEATNNCITEDGWFKSGDLGFLDSNGSLTIVDRLKEIMKVKGYQVAPAELENVIKEHPAVLDAAVIGVPDQRAGEKPKAFVVLKDGKTTENNEIVNFVAERVTEYKRLKEVVFLDSLPKNPSGKLLRRILREKYC